MAEHEPTLGEVWRRVEGHGHDIRDLRKELIGRPEYESDQEGIDRRFRVSDTVHAEIRAEQASQKAEFRGDLKALRDRMDASEKADQQRRDEIEKEQRQNRQTRTFAVALAVFTSILAVVMPVLLRGA
ncbi:MAG TPA: hypothetical protein VKY79_03760 [Actinomycetaceae bacterium]|jgi:hypothetical protein|nr:hypothetical protein [Actinomycetaceae bacterium]